MCLFPVLVFLLLISSQCLCSNILAVFLYSGPSHQLILQTVLEVIATRGHNLTVVNTVPMKTSFGNVKEIIINAPTVEWKEIFSFEESVSASLHTERKHLQTLAEGILSSVETSKEIKYLMESDSEFDVVLTESTFFQEPMVIFGHRFNAPVISIVTSGITTMGDFYSGNYHNPSFIPEFELHYSYQMNFAQRARNFFEWLFHIAEHYYHYTPKRLNQVKHIFNYPESSNMPSLKELLSNVSLYLINADSTVLTARPKVPNVIEIPGVHIKPTQSLPQDFEEIMNTSKDGVILFTLGSMIPVSKMALDKRQAFVDAFSKIKQTVVWKSDMDIPNLSPNVIIKKWLPQQGMLAHPKCVAFITHGGLLSKQEAVYFGVPVIGIPLFGDQPSNIAHSEYKGIGKTLHYESITASTIIDNINEVIYNESYYNNLHRLSAAFKEKVASSKADAIFWIEYVIRHKGAVHLKQSNSLNWFQYYLLDVIAFLLLVFVSIILVLVVTIKNICGRCTLIMKRQKNK